MKEYKCSNCFFCNPGYFTHWCIYYNKLCVFQTGCTRDTTVLDYDYDDSLDEDDD